MGVVGVRVVLVFFLLWRQRHKLVNSFEERRAGTRQAVCPPDFFTIFCSDLAAVREMLNIAHEFSHTRRYFMLPPLGANYNLLSVCVCVCV